MKLITLTLALFVISPLTYGQQANVGDITLKKALNTQGSDAREKILNEVLAGASEQSAQAKGSSLRYDAVGQQAYHWGLSEGLFYQHGVNQDTLVKNTTLLNRIADFSKFIVDGKLLLPTAMEAKRIYEQISSNEARTVNVSYTLHRPAQIVSSPPTWREYLFRTVEQPIKPDSVLLPRDKQEKSIFTHQFQAGWEAGTRQANMILDNDFRMLERDLNGHYVFRQLAVQNIVRLPSINKIDNNVVVSSDGRTINVDDVIYRISVPEGFENIGKWEPIFTSSTSSESK